MKERMELAMERLENGGDAPAEVETGVTVPNPRSEGRPPKRGSALGQMKRAVGMTLVEIMIVITIIAMVSGAVGYFVFGALDTANEGVAENDITRITEMVNTYYVRNGQLPNELSALAEDGTALLEEVPEDPWGNEYIYERHGPRDFTIYSAGPDGTPGTDADVHADD